MTPEEYVRVAHVNPPRCIAQLRPLPLLELADGMEVHPFIAYFTVGCPCGGREAFLLGYPFKSSPHDSEPFFLSPLAIECADCKQVSELFDSRQHGYDGEQGENCCKVGEGERVRVLCPNCGEAPMVIMPSFAYQFYDDDLDEWGDRMQDFFDGFGVDVRCVKCGRLTSPSGFECA